VIGTENVSTEETSGNPSCLSLFHDDQSTANSLALEERGKEMKPQTRPPPTRTAQVLTESGESVQCEILTDSGQNVQCGY